MRIWTSEHVFNHSWESVTCGQWQKYPNPHNNAVLGTDVVERRVEEGVLHSHRIITSDWGLSDWVQKLIGSNRVCYASEHSSVDPNNRIMEMHSKNLTFCRYVNMEEKMRYTPDPLDKDKTVLHQEMIVTVQGVPLTSYMEGIIVNTVSNNSSKGRAAIEWVVEKLGQECRALSLYSSLDKLKSEISDLKHTVAESLILPAKKSIEELQQDVTRRIQDIDIKKIDINLPKKSIEELQLDVTRRIQDIPLPSPPMVSAEEKLQTSR